MHLYGGAAAMLDDVQTSLELTSALSSLFFPALPD